MANETTIGAKLRQARLNKKISLDELQQMTKIQKRYLEAMEADRFDALPGTYYVRAFIRQYAAAVGEDGNRLVAVFDGKASLEPPLPKRQAPETVSTSRTAIHEEEKSGSFVVRYLPMILLGMVALTIIGIVGYMTWQERNAEPLITPTNSSMMIENSRQSSTKVSETSSTTTISSETSSSTESSSTTESSEKMAIKLENSTQTDATIAITDAKDPVELTFNGLDAPCWIGIIINDAYVYQYTLQANEKQTTTLPENATNATIILGASKNVEIQANGTKVDFQDPKYEALQKNLYLTIQYQSNLER